MSRPIPTKRVRALDAWGARQALAAVDAAAPDCDRCGALDRELAPVDGLRTNDGRGTGLRPFRACEPCRRVLGGPSPAPSRPVHASPEVAVPIGACDAQLALPGATS